MMKILKNILVLKLYLKVSLNGYQNMPVKAPDAAAAPSSPYGIQKWYKNQNGKIRQ